MWYPPSIDVDRGVTYWGIGNPAPWPGTGAFPNGSSRPGPNLYTNSIVALDHDSGELEWFNQVKPHGLFDHDFQLTPILATVNIEGSDRDIAIGAGKLGKVIAFDRDTGEMLWSTPVGVHNGNAELTELPLGVTEVFPGAFGGVLTPTAYAEGVVYVPVVNGGHRFSSTEFLGSVGASTGEMTAIAADSGEILWSTDFDSMVTAGDELRRDGNGASEKCHSALRKQESVA